MHSSKTTIQEPAITNEREVILSVKHLHKSFGKNRVLNDFNLVLHRQENIVVLGKSGSGKSVLIKCIIGLLKPDSGTIEVFGKDITGISGSGLDKIRVKMGFLFQSNALYDSMTVRQNLEFPLRRHAIRVNQAEVDRLVMQALEDVGLRHTVDMMPAELSGGMRKRIALARTLILRPEIILYDEPTTGLDPITAKEIINLMLSIQKKYHAASIIISHDLNCVRKTSDKVIMLINGTCYAEDSFEKLAQMKDREISAFFD